MELVPLLKSLSEAAGVSGYEDAGVARLASAELGRLADEVRCDALGNVIALKRGLGPEPRRRVMLAGHMDEIGFLVTMLEKGFLRFTQVGGFDARTLPGQQITVHGRRDLPGIIGSRPPHVLSAADQSRTLPLDELFIDVGLSEADLARDVRVGDLITMRAPFTELRNGMVCGKAFDDRAAVAAMAVCLDALRGLRHEWDVYAVATVQEEVGLRGAMTSTYGIVPDVGIAIDVGFARQPGVAEPDAIDFNKGPALAMGPNLHPALFAALKKVADDNEIPVQTEVAAGGTGTDANAMQLTRDGIPTALLSLPLRNMHTPVETLSLKDVARTGRLLALFIASLDAAFLDTLTWPASGCANGKEGSAA